MGKDARNHLLLYLNLGYALLIIYASLYPLTGWHDSGSNPLDFLGASWPRYWTAFDLATNVIAYLPFGFLCAATLRLHLRPLPACLLAASLGVALSLGLEITQHYLPNRVPSNLDLCCNGAGALLGAVAGALWGRHVFSDRHHAIWQGHVMTKVYGADFGVLLMAAWLMTQLSPEILLFGTGDLRQMLDLPQVQPFAPERFAHVEATIAAAGLPGYESSSLQGVFAPAGVPAPILQKLTQEIVRYLHTADAKEKYLAVGVEVVGSSPEQFTAAMKAEMARMGKVIRDAGIRED